MEQKYDERDDSVIDLTTEIFAANCEDEELVRLVRRNAAFRGVIMDDEKASRYKEICDLCDKIHKLNPSITAEHMNTDNTHRSVYAELTFFAVEIIDKTISGYIARLFELCDSSLVVTHQDGYEMYLSFDINDLWRD